MGRVGRPVAPCQLCRGPREAGQRVKIGGKQIPVCASCARRAPGWSTHLHRRSRLRGSGKRFDERSSR